MDGKAIPKLIPLLCKQFGSNLSEPTDHSSIGYDDFIYHYRLAETEVKWNAAWSTMNRGEIFRKENKWARKKSKLNGN